MIGGAKGIGIGIDFGLPNLYRKPSGKSYIEPDVLASLRVVTMAYGKKNSDSDRAIIKNLVDPDNPFIISNAAYKLNSGFGLYQLDFDSLDRTDQSELTTDYKSVTISKIIKESDGNVIYNWSKNLPALDSVRIQVKGLDEIGARLVFIYLNDSGQNVRTTYHSDGIYTLPSSSAHAGNSYTTNFRLAIFGYTGDCNVTITQIPQYEGAFVTDGIDDLITSTKTVQEMLGGSNEITVVSMIHQVKDTANNVSFTNYIRGSANGYFRNIVNNYGKTGIYGYTSSDLRSLSVINNILGDKNDYTSNGDNRDTIINGNFSVQGYSYNNSSNTGDFSSVAWYWTIIANKVLTTDQINQVIAYFNLDRTLNPDILCNTIKQGITNENHAEFGDKLIDFSGNGRDIQLNNIAWKLNSGIGEYAADFLTWSSPNRVQKTSFEMKLPSDYKDYWVAYNPPNTAFKAMKVLISGIPNGGALQFFRTTADGGSIKMVNGINEIPAFTNTVVAGFYIAIPLGFDWSNLVITQISSNAGALCLDGVDDFGKVTGMPIYKDYTVVTDREIFANTGAILSKNNPGAFVETAGNSVYSFGQATSDLNFISTRSISYLSKYSYCGQSITAGAAEDGTDMWLGTIRDNDSRFFNGAIYSLMTFPYSMSKFLIERQLKKHKLGTLYPDMVEFRPIVKSNVEYSDVVYLNYSNGLATINVGDYVDIGDTVAIRVVLSNTVDEVVNAKVNGQECEIVNVSPKVFDCKFTITSKSPQKIDITIDEYIRYEDIVQPYPVLLRFKDESGNEVSWGGKFRVGSTVTRIGSIADAENNLLNGLYSVSGLSLNGKAVTTSISVVEKQMVFKTTATYLLGSNKPKCVLSPSRLNIPNSSYKILGYIPDLSGNGNHGILNNSAYAEGSGVNADGSYQLDGVDDFITIPTTVGGKQVLMKVNWQSSIAQAILYDQRGYGNEFAIWNSNSLNDNVDGVIPAYQSKNNGQTYIDGILNNNIKASELRAITHNITITNELSSGVNSVYPVIGANKTVNNYFANMSLYDFMLFDDISTDEEILNLNKYIGIEPKVTVPPYYWDAYGKANNNTDDIEGTRHALWNKADMTNAGQALICENLSYDEMSGYGGYSFKSFDTVSRWNVYDATSVIGVEIVNRNGYSVTLRKKAEDFNAWQFNYGTSVKDLTEDLKFKFKCDKTIKIVWQLKYQVTDGEAYQTETLVSQEVEANTEADISLIHKTAEQLAELGAIKHYYLIFFNNAKLAIDEEYTITMLPLYPNGLCIDGVTDYLSNANVPALTDFTVIAKREWFNKSKYLYECFAHKGIIDTPIGETAFMLEYEIGNDTYYRSSSYGGYLNVERSNRPEKIVYQTPTSYNGTSITRGSGADTTGLIIGAVTNNYWKGVFYKLMLYPKTLTNLEIMFLKNLFERDEIIDLTNPIFIQK